MGMGYSETSEPGLVNEDVTAGYFAAFENVSPPNFPAMSAKDHHRWHLCAGLTIGLALWYLHWRWTASLNEDAFVFSVLVASAESALFIGTLLFFYDIWAEGDTPEQKVPVKRSDVALEGTGDIGVDIFITTYDEDISTVAPSIEDACSVFLPVGVQTRIYLLDDGGRPEMQSLAKRFGVTYLTRDTNKGFKAGNLFAALMQTRGDFIVICDADTRLFPAFLERTLGYFRDPKVAWVQTPHWFYDIPPGREIESALTQQLGSWRKPFARTLVSLLGRQNIGADPFKADPKMFFDVIQRRRNRHGASFCCGAGSIHRREPLFEFALGRSSKSAQEGAFHAQGMLTAAGLRAAGQEPFRFHVSEDLFTSLDLHSAGWRSVYHPEVLARMLSPWSAKAWATQKLKYAGGTLDIGLRTRAFFTLRLPWRIRLHYLATLWSYLSLLWLPVLLFAPVYSLLFAQSPIGTHSVEFFLHLLPLLLLNELSMVFACKAYDTHSGRAQTVAALPIYFRAFFMVASGARPEFPTTPKLPGETFDFRFAKPAILMLTIMICTAIWGIFWASAGHPDYTASLLTVNLFWLLVNGSAFVHVIRFCAWQPQTALSAYVSAKNCADL